MQEIVKLMLLNKEFLYIDGVHYASRSALALGMGFCNKNYFEHFGQSRKMIRAKGYTDENIEDFYKRSYTMLKRDVSNIIDGLQEQGFLSFDKTYVVTPKDSRGNLGWKPREATPEEIAMIKKADDTVLEMMGFTELWNVFASKRQKEFYRNLHLYYSQTYNFSHVFQAYKITISKEVSDFFDVKREEKLLLSQAKVTAMRKNLAPKVKERFKHIVEETSQIRKEEGSKYPYGYIHKRQLVSMASSFLGYKTEEEQDKYRRELEKLDMIETKTMK